MLFKNKYDAFLYQKYPNKRNSMWWGWDSANPKALRKPKNCLKIAYCTKKLILTQNLCLAKEIEMEY